MSERFTQHGLSLTLDEVREVLVYWDHETKYLPKCVGISPTRYLVLDQPPYPALTPALIEDLDNWAYPWEDATGADLMSGDRLRVMHAGVYTAAAFLDESRGRLCVKDDGYVLWIARHDPIQIRRARVAHVRLGDVKRGSVVKAEGLKVEGMERRVLDSDKIGFRRVLDESTWVSDIWPVDTPVEIVEEPHEPQ